MRRKKTKPRQVGGKYASLALLLALLWVSGCEAVTPAPATPASASPSPTIVTSEVRTPTPTTQASPLPPTETPESSLDVPVESLQGVQVSLWHPWTGDAAQALEGLINRFQSESEHGFRVVPQYVGPYDELSNQVMHAIGSEDAETPALAVAFSYLAQDWEGVVDITPYLEDPLWGLGEEEQEDFITLFQNAVAQGDALYSLPAIRTADVLYYNQSWAEELGFQSPPTTPQQFQRQACAASRSYLEDDNPDNNGTGGWIVSHEYPTMLGWMRAYRAEVVSRGGYDFDSPPVIEAFTFLRGLYDLGCSWLPGEIDTKESFAERGGLFATGTTSGILDQHQAFRTAGNQDRWTVISYPSREGNPAIQAFGPDFVMLSSTPEQQLGGWLFLRWLMQPEQQAELIKGFYSLPLRESARVLLEQNSDLLPQYQAALDLLSVAHTEPPYRSWGVVRWAVYDAGTQLYRFYYNIADAPALAELLNETAEHLHEREP